MHLSKLQIVNFRALKNIEVEFDALVNVVIGPNAIGKTTILEAVRLAKAVLAPRTQNEAQQTLIKVGLMSPHMTNQIFSHSITNNPQQPTEIKCAYNLEDAEIKIIEGRLPLLQGNFALQSIGMQFSAPAQAMSFLSSPQGKAAFAAAGKKIAEGYEQLKLSRKLNLNLHANFQTGQLIGEFPIQQLFYTALEQTLDPSKTIFSYYAADRAMPIGETQPIHIGFQDSLQQLESYNSQPELKYNRLKQTIFNAIIGQQNGREELSKQFDLVFSRILKGRELGSVGLNQFGGLSIQIVDKETGAKFDIDGLSSGEKGLILTCLNISRTISHGGVILLDEPELHLNPAVCRDLLQFIVDEYAEKNNMQALICSHSAEILAGAFERDRCSLFHLRNGTTLAKVRQHDHGEIRDALRRLGSSESEALLFKGTISVEGIHDVEVLQSGFDLLLGRYKLKPLGGRGQIEADIKELQKAEAKNDEIGYHFFLFDHDRMPSSLSDTKFVKLRQLRRYCLENYLLDADIITDLTRERDYSDTPQSNVTDTIAQMKKLALDQLTRVACFDVFKDMKLEDIAFNMRNVAKLGVPDLAKEMSEQLARIAALVAGVSGNDFESRFQRLCEQRVHELRPHWEDNWREFCNGKILFEDMRSAGIVRGDLLRLKKRIAAEMRLRKTESWSSLNALLQDLIRI